MTLYDKAYYEAHKERFQGYYRTQIERHGIEHRRAISNASYQRAKAETFQHYGNVCVCCGETNPGFLTLDHINPDEKQRKFRESAFKEARRLGYPDTFRVMCWNCNCGRAYNDGICPHQTSV